MALNYDFNIKDGIFKYNCIEHHSYIEIKAKDIKKIYCILNKLDVIRKLAWKGREKTVDYNGFRIIFNFNEYVAINTISNCLNIKEEVPIIKRELSKYIKNYDKESVKDIIVKIKSLKKGGSNIIKEELKWEKLLFQEK